MHTHTCTRIPAQPGAALESACQQLQRPFPRSASLDAHAQVAARQQPWPDAHSYPCQYRHHPQQQQQQKQVYTVADHHQPLPALALQQQSPQQQQQPPQQQQAGLAGLPRFAAVALEGGAAGLAGLGGPGRGAAKPWSTLTVGGAMDGGGYGESIAALAEDMVCVHAEDMVCVHARGHGVCTCEWECV